MNTRCAFLQTGSSKRFPLAWCPSFFIGRARLAPCDVGPRDGTTCGKPGGNGISVLFFTQFAFVSLVLPEEVE